MIQRCWDGETVVIAATGPSITQLNLEYLTDLDLKVIAVNDSWKLFPSADILYAADAKWWRFNKYAESFKGERWTQPKGPTEWPTEAASKGINIVDSANLPGLSLDPSVIHTGGNSGFQALNLAVLMGANKIVLLGIDCVILDGKRHWFGDHQGELNRKSPYHFFISSFNAAAPQLKNLGVEVINCSERSAVSCFKKMNLADCL